MARNKVYWWDAPKGYKAVPSLVVWGANCWCDGCSFFPGKACPETSCFSHHRKDKHNVIFVKRTQSK